MSRLSAPASHAAEISGEASERVRDDLRATFARRDIADGAIIARYRPDLDVVRTQSRGSLMYRALISIVVRRGYLAAMVIPKVTEIQSLSAHRRDLPPVRPAAQKSEER